MREYMKGYREKQKLLAASSEPQDTCKTNSKSNVSRLDKNREEKIREEENIPPKSPKEKRGNSSFDYDNPFVGELKSAFDDWVAYKIEKRQPYKPRGLQSLITQIQRYADQFGDFATANAIRNSMASNYAGIVFDRIGNGEKPKKKKPNYEGSRDFFDDD
jgi:hypothetical protein